MLLIEQQNVVLHEMIHLLGFNTLLFSFYRNELGQPRTPRCPEASGCKSSDPPTFPPYNLSTNSFSVSQSTVATLGDLQYLVTPTVTDIARSYYGCELLIGAPLENDTTVLSAGSHWKQRLLLGELMTGQFVSTPVLSEFTLAALADSGWFVGNELTAADIIMSFPLEAAAARGGASQGYPNILSFLARIKARQAWQTALGKGGPYQLMR